MVQINLAAAISQPQFTAPMTARRFGHSAASVIIRWQALGMVVFLSVPIMLSVPLWSNGLDRLHGSKISGETSWIKWSIHSKSKVLNLRHIRTKNGKTALPRAGMVLWGVLFYRSCA